MHSLFRRLFCVCAILLSAAAHAEGTATPATSASSAAVQATPQASPASNSPPQSSSAAAPSVAPTTPATAPNAVSVAQPTAPQPNSTSSTTAPSNVLSSMPPDNNDEENEKNALISDKKSDPNQTEDKGPYTEVTWTTILHAIIRDNALDVLNDNLLLDEYAMITECDLYKFFYKDDFKWNNVRSALRKSIRENLNKYPLRFKVDVKLQLSRYDFDKQIYNFSDHSQIKHVNTLNLFTADGDRCGSGYVKNIPLKYRGVTNDPFTLTGIPLSAKDAQALLNLMTASRNVDHIIFAQFNVTVLYIQPMRKGLKNLTAGDMIYTQSSSRHTTDFRLDIKLDSIEFFSDPTKTIRIYTFTPEK